MKVAITGGCGFLGSNIAAAMLRDGHTVAVLDNLSRVGAAENLSWLKAQGDISHSLIDIRNASEVSAWIEQQQPDAILHFAGQVAMTTSIIDPRADFEINALGSINILEAVREHCPRAIVAYSSTNKVYGDLEQYQYEEGELRYRCVERPEGFAENEQLDFHSPYGCSKGSADQYFLDYHRIFGLRTVVFRHSSMYGGRQFATNDQGWVGWFCQQAALASTAADRTCQFTIHGNGKQVRDVLHADDMVGLYRAVFAHADKAEFGRAYNVGGGINNSLSLLELFQLLNEQNDVKLQPQSLAVRESDQRVFVADLTSVNNAFGWQPNVDCATGVRSAVEWAKERLDGNI